MYIKVFDKVYIYNVIYICVYVVGAKMFLNIKLPNHASRGFQSPLNK